MLRLRVCLYHWSRRGLEGKKVGRPQWPWPLHLLCHSTVKHVTRYCHQEHVVAHIQWKKILTRPITCLKSSFSLKFNILQATQLCIIRLYHLQQNIKTTYITLYDNKSDNTAWNISLWTGIVVYCTYPLGGLGACFLTNILGKGDALTLILRYSASNFFLTALCVM